MRAMAVDAAAHRLREVRKPVPAPGAHEVLVRVRACGVCRTDLHVIDGELPPHRAEVVPGHEVVGEVVTCGAGATRFAPGVRIGIPWLGRACGHCPYCRMQRENLCDQPLFTGYDRDGGYAEYAVADERFCFALPEHVDDLHAAPLLCAGLIGFRTWRLAGGTAARRIGLWGFGAAAHIVCQLAVGQGQEVFAFTRPGDAAGQAFARSLGAAWAGSSAERPPQELDAALIFAPAGPLVPAALATVRKGGVVVCGGIHMSDIPAFPYALLWGEREVRSVANLTRADGEDFFALLQRVPVRTHVQSFALADANAAVEAVRAGRLEGAAVLVP
ncbi:MAG TPA: zinc-dependent alcohol dehydrogenase family protein [Ramlibacter sp.]|uniref:zinc-dependent alcohol dehydrogenase family protein n=1 Tax=Ramlibacter sp. TaxID=1917967 RepID=UPI002D7F1DC1|nr:zinc-dependent alcohol dehydrogenase family protein [Ramlibacter sp.]HET8746769.1 zinc-dependent alcohol dehydrogenase family protein [Ramlibacter sp.]